MFYLFVWSLSSHSWIVHSFRDVTMTGVNFDLYSAHIAIESESSLACHTYYDTGHLVIMVISENPWHSHLLQAFAFMIRSGTFTAYSYELGLSRLRFEHSTFRWWGERTKSLGHSCGSYLSEKAWMQLQSSWEVDWFQVIYNNHMFFSFSLK